MRTAVSMNSYHERVPLEVPRSVAIGRLRGRHRSSPKKKDKGFLEFDRSEISYKISSSMENEGLHHSYIHL